MAEHKKWMEKCLELASRAAERGEVPVGAVVVKEGRLISSAYNLRESLNSPLAHAEVLALHRAAKKLRSWRLTGCDLYVNLEPCPMCAGAILQSRIKRIVFGTTDPKAGAVKSLYELLSDSRLNHQTEVISGVFEKESRQLLKGFFKALRSASK